MTGTLSFPLDGSAEPVLTLGLLEMLRKYLLSQWMNEQPVQKRSRRITLFHSPLSRYGNECLEGPSDTAKETQKVAELRHELYLLTPRMPLLISSLRVSLSDHWHSHSFGLVLGMTAHYNSPMTLLLTYLTLSPALPHFPTAQARRISLLHVTIWQTLTAAGNV